MSIGQDGARNQAEKDARLVENRYQRSAYGRGLLVALMVIGNLGRHTKLEIVSIKTALRAGETVDGCDPPGARRLRVERFRIHTPAKSLF